MFFFLPSYLPCSQIWLNYILDDHHFVKLFNVLLVVFFFKCIWTLQIYNHPHAFVCYSKKMTYHQWTWQGFQPQSHKNPTHCNSSPTCNKTHLVNKHKINKHQINTPLGKWQQCHHHSQLMEGTISSCEQQRSHALTQSWNVPIKCSYLLFCTMVYY